jgi:hypothetical protein
VPSSARVLKAEAEELPQLSKPSDPTSGPFGMMILSLTRTERMADLRWIFKVRRNFDQSELDSHVETCVAGANTRVMDLTDTKVNVINQSNSMTSRRYLIYCAKRWPNRAGSAIPGARTFLREPGGSVATCRIGGDMWV